MLYHLGAQRGSMTPIIKACASMLSDFSCVRLCSTLWTVACQAPLSMGFSRQEYWSGLPRPPPGDLPDPGIKPASLMSPILAGGLFTTSATWEILGSFQIYCRWPILLCKKDKNSDISVCRNKSRNPHHTPRTCREFSNPYQGCEILKTNKSYGWLGNDYRAKCTSKNRST